MDYRAYSLVVKRATLNRLTVVRSYVGLEYDVYKLVDDLQSAVEDGC